MQRIKLAKSLGFCSGVCRAINIAESAIKRSKGKVYSLGSIIHNHEEIDRLKRMGLIGVKSLNQVENGACLILPSHGSPRCVAIAARKKRLKLVDVTCPFVNSVHKICKRLYQDKFQVIVIGDRDHPEVRALVDLAPGAIVVESPKDIPVGRFKNRKVGIISQTTQSREKLFEMAGLVMKCNPDSREFQVYNTICLDSTRRQEEVKILAKAVDRLVVIGSRTSANTKRLFALGRKVNPRTFLAENTSPGLLRKLKGAARIGVISGASAPRWLVDRTIESIKVKK